MRNYVILLRTMMRSLFRFSPNQKRSRLAAYIAIGIALLILGAFIAVSLAFAAPHFLSAGILAELLTSIYSAVFIMMFIFGTVGIMSYVYYEKDSEFLLSLPVKTEIIFMAKLSVVYVQEALLSFVFSVPGSIAIGIATGQGFVFYPLVLLAAILVPVFSLLFSSIATIPIMAISSLFKNKGLLGTILALLFFAGFMVVYIIAINGVQSSASSGDEIDIDAIVLSSKDALIAASLVFYPFLAFSRAATGNLGLTDSLVTSSLIDLAIFFGAFLLLAVLVMLLGKGLYKRGVLSYSTGRASTKVEKRNYESSGVLKALMKKEWKSVYRNQHFAFQCMAGYVISPIFAIVYPFVFSQGEDHLGITEMSLMICMLINIMSVALNVFASTAISREGKSFVFSKTIPIPYETQLRAKRNVGLILSSISIVISLVCFGVISFVLYGQIDLLTLILSAIFLMLLTVFTINRDILHDLKKPNLTWTNPREITKNNFAIVPLMLLGMLFGIIGFILPMVLYIVFEDFMGLGAVGIAIAFTVCIGAVSIMAYMSNRSLVEKGPALYESVEA